MNAHSFNFKSRKMNARSLSNKKSELPFIFDTKGACIILANPNHKENYL